jgi:hypothetical protein
MSRLAIFAVISMLSLGLTLGACGATPAQSIELGLVSNADQGLRAARIGALGARFVRVEFRIDATPAQLAPVIARFARRGVSVLPLAGFSGRIPSRAEAQNLVSWAREFGPSGGFWRGRAHPELAIRAIEFGNETNLPGQFGGCGAGCPAYLQRAGAYARALAAAQEAIAGPAGNPAVGLLAIGDDGGAGSPEWVDGMFAAVPDLARRIAGWTAHPYGLEWRESLDRLIAQTGARGAPATIPIFITELGIASDNGECLSNNFGWNPCMTYAEAARTLKGTVVAIRARYGSRIKAIFVYQAFDQRLPLHDKDREHYLGALTADGRPKGAYTEAIRSLMRSSR